VQPSIARACLWPLVAAAALASALPAPARAEVAGATELFRQGVAALREGSYPEAVSLFRLSYDMEVRAATQCNLALAYERWTGHDQEALEAYRRCAEDDREGRFRERALERSQEIRRRLGTSGEGGGVAAPPPRTGPTGPGLAPGPGGAAGASPPSGEAGGTGGRRQGLVIGHPLLWTGVAVGLLALGSFGSAIGLHVWAGDIHRQLSDRYPDRVIARGSADADRLAQGQAVVGGALALYIVGGILAAASTVLISIDLTQAPTEVEATLIGVAPTRGGLALTLALPF
jgi:hypothetical protein